MANEQQNNPTRSFDKGLQNDVRDYHSSPRQYTFCRNSIPNSTLGDLGDIGNEPANLHLVDAPYTIIGFIYLFADTWAVFSTNDTDSEIGRFVESTATYTTVVNDSYYVAPYQKLNLNRANLIIGEAKENFDCSWHIYWSDGNNVDRTMNFDSPPWIQLCTDSAGNTQIGNQQPSNFPLPFPVDCLTCVPFVLAAPFPYTGFVLDVNAIRLAKLVKTPCVHVIKGAGGGNLPNGSYFVVTSYLINGQRVTDYFPPSNVQPIFDHSGVAGSIDVIVDSMDLSFDEFQLVVVSTVNQQVVAKNFGIYNTRQKSITIDIIDKTLPDVPVAQIPIHNPIADKSDGMYAVGNYLVRVGPTNKFDFNYQPLANLITVKWVVAEYPSTYYKNGGSNTSRMRDENYCEFIQWIFDDGDVSSSYHIPGRPAYPSDLITVANADAAIEISEGSTPLQWMVYNTATLSGPTIAPAVPTGDGGFIIQEGLMGYWESTELYPDDKSNVYNASANPWSTIGATTPTGSTLNVPYGGTAGGIADYDLCGKPIRHHKFPEQRLSPNLVHFGSPAVATLPGGAPAITGDSIRILGTKYENINQPVDNNGVPIPGVVGYRILRGSRDGNKTIVAKGMINNMFSYTIEGGVTTRTGLYPNYPYNDVGVDPFISTTDPTGDSTGHNPNATINPDTVTFHSPDTQFRKPYLSMKELKVYGQINGDVDGRFVAPDKHPEHKFITDAAFIAAAVAGIGIAAIAMNGERTTTYTLPQKKANSNSGRTKDDSTDITEPTISETVGEVTEAWAAPYGSGTVTDTSIGNTLTPQSHETGTLFTAYWGLNNPESAVTSGATITALTNAETTGNGMEGILAAIDTQYFGLGVQLGSNVGGQGTSTYQGQINSDATAGGQQAGMDGIQVTRSQNAGSLDNTPSILNVLQAIPTFVYYWSQGTDATLRIIDALIRFEQYALQYQSHCYYNGWANSTIGDTRRLIQDEIYLDNQLQDFGTSLRINNLFRNESVCVNTTAPFSLPVGDNSKQTVGSAKSAGLLNSFSNIDATTPFKTVAVSHYAALKNRILNQYGQIGGVKQIPINSCIQDTTSNIFPFSSSPFFGGDTYVTRYTEKNTMFFFYDWLYGQPNGFEFNYHLKKNVPFPMYWMDTKRWDVADFINGLGTGLTGGGWGSLLPDGLHSFDRSGSIVGIFSIKEAYMYLFNSGVRDFYVESEVNTDLRDWGDNNTQRFYDPYRYTDTLSLFNAKPEIIKSGEYFKYDYSLSISKMFTQQISWANIQPINYDPTVYASCYVHNPNLVIYSLPSTDNTSQQAQLIKDNWTVYLANNYKYFQTPVSSIKGINKSGAMFFFGTQSPQQIVGVDTLTLGSGVDATVGTGALFSQPLQNLSSSDRPYEYGSCQNRLSVANTPMGLFWMSPSSGKIFQLQQGIQEISMTDLKWWFAQYLPYMLLESFPTFELTDNPVIGIGCQTIFDNENTLVYFMKKDYKLLPAYVNIVQYVGRDDFMVNGILPIKLGDPRYFEDASWCAQFDPKTREWVGFQDWRAELCLPGKNTFSTTKTNNLGQGGIWLHNERCDLYCNYYGIDYPFEVEYRADTAQQTNTLRSVEHQVEVYLYAPNCHDRYLQLETYFDRAVVFNNEQVSGYLNLIQTPFNDPYATLNYPIINANSMDILYSKVEGKYRFNGFFDIVDDRGEFTNAKRMIFNTAANGYAKVLNPLNLNYNKDPFQRKRFRGYNNSVWLQKKVCGPNKILVILVNNKLLNSPR